MWRRDGRSVSGVKLGATWADSSPRQMNQSRPNQCRRTTLMGPGHPIKGLYDVRSLHLSETLLPFRWEVSMFKPKTVLTIGRRNLANLLSEEEQ